MGKFALQIEEIRTRARKSIEDGAVTGTYRGDRKQLIELLNASLATEIVCVLRYKKHYEDAAGLEMESVRAEFLEHANEEQGHADQIAERISQLGGDPDYNPVGLAERSHSQYVVCESLVEMIKENLIAERIAIEIYTEMIRFIGDDDPTTRRMLEGILENEEEHADDMATFLKRVSKN